MMVYVFCCFFYALYMVVLIFCFVFIFWLSFVYLSVNMFAKTWIYFRTHLKCSPIKTKSIFFLSNFKIAVFFFFLWKNKKSRLRTKESGRKKKKKFRPPLCIAFSLIFLYFLWNIWKFNCFFKKLQFFSPVFFFLLFLPTDIVPLQLSDV